MKFELHQPLKIADALSLAARYGDGARFIAGGTDLVIQMRRKRHNPAHLIDLSQLRGLNEIVETEDGFRLGAMVSHKALERFPAFRDQVAMLAAAAHVVGGHQVRNVGTIGGNVANASPAADVVVPLLALDAGLTLQSSEGLRETPLRDFLLGPGRTTCRPDEMLTSIYFAKLPAGTGTAFLKSGRRKAMEISVVCVAACLSVANDICSGARIALGAVGPTTLRAYSAEAMLEGTRVDPEIVGQAARRAAADCTPISDVRASADYRRLLVEVLVERALHQCIERAREVPA